MTSSRCHALEIVNSSQETVDDICNAPLDSCGLNCKRRSSSPSTRSAHPNCDFKVIYAAAKARGFILYPGKLTHVETFRVGCIGAIGPTEMRQAVNVVGEVLRELGISTAR